MRRKIGAPLIASQRDPASENMTTAVDFKCVQCMFSYVAASDFGTVIRRCFARGQVVRLALWAAGPRVQYGWYLSQVQKKLTCVSNCSCIKRSGSHYQRSLKSIQARELVRVDTAVSVSSNRREYVLHVQNPSAEEALQYKQRVCK